MSRRLAMPSASSRSTAATTRQSARSSWRRLGVATTVVASAVALAAPSAPALAAPATDAAASTTSTLLANRVILGANGDRATLEARTGSNLAAHDYSDLRSSVPLNARLYTVGSGSSWRTVANAAPGSALHNDIVRWANTLKSRSGVMLAYQHEPETAGNTKMGTAADFIAAYRNVVTIFRQQGATNVKFTWQMTAWAFRTSPSDRAAAAKWYPGDAYVDSIGADAYNWSVCGEGRGKWVELSTLVDPVLAFARARGKTASLPEFASHAGANRAQWLDNARQYLARNKSVIDAVFYFNRPPTNSKNSNCRWPLSTSAEYAEYAQMAKETANFGI